MSAYQTTTAPVPATEAQVRFIEKLLAEKDLTGTIFEGHTHCPEGLTKAAASADIARIKDLPRLTTRKTETGEAVTEGMYQDPTGQIFKVQKAVHGSGQLYAKLLVITGEGLDRTGRFEFAPGAIRKLRPEWKMSLEQAQAFGRLYGICCQCGAILTDETSIELGIGPVCRSKF